MEEPVFSANWLKARLWSSLVMALKHEGLSDLAFFIAIKQLVLAGLPTTKTLTDLLALSARAFPCSTKMAPFCFKRSARSMPGPLGFEPTRKTASQSLNPTERFEVVLIPCKRGKAQSSSSILTPFNLASMGAMSTKLRMTGWFLPKTSPEAILKAKA